MRAVFQSLTMLYFILVFCAPALAQGEQELAGNEGYLVVSLKVSGIGFEALWIRRNGAVGEGYTFTNQNMYRGINYVVIKAKAGRYSWGRLKTVNVGGRGLEKGMFDFVVSPGKINYGGHMVIEYLYMRPSIKLLNRASQAINHMTSCCQSLLDKYEFQYVAGEADPFLQYLSGLPDHPLSKLETD